jgi:hypothetical protein
MNEDELEKEIEKRVEKNIATRLLLANISKVMNDAVEEGCLKTKDLVDTLTAFVTQGYIVVYGYDEESEKSFKDTMIESWKICKKKYQQEKGEVEVEDDDLMSVKYFIKELHERLNGN